MTSIRRGRRERAVAWAVTGPPGHLWSMSADVVVLWARILFARLRRGWPRGASGPTS